MIILCLTIDFTDYEHIFENKVAIASEKNTPGFLYYFINSAKRIGEWQFSKDFSFAFLSFFLFSPRSIMSFLLLRKPQEAN